MIADSNFSKIAVASDTQIDIYAVNSTQQYNLIQSMQFYNHITALAFNNDSTVLVVANQDYNLRTYTYESNQFQFNCIILINTTSAINSIFLDNFSQAIITAGFIQILSVNKNSTCSPPSTCSINSYWNTYYNSCIPCNGPCKCQYCNICIDNNACQSCLSGYFMNSSSLCSPCGPNCLSCSNSAQCSSCATGYYLNTTTMSCGSCSLGYYLSGSNCSSCPANCRKCNSSMCTLCNDQYVLNSGASCEVRPSSTSNTTVILIAALVPSTILIICGVIYLVSQMKAKIKLEPSQTSEQARASNNGIHLDGIRVDDINLKHIKKPVNKNRCFLCSTSKPTIRTSCGHYFHLHCIAKQNLGRNSANQIQPVILCANCDDTALIITIQCSQCKNFNETITRCAAICTYNRPIGSNHFHCFQEQYFSRETCTKCRL